MIMMMLEEVHKTLEIAEEKKGMILHNLECWRDCYRSVRWLGGKRRGIY